MGAARPEGGGWIVRNGGHRPADELGVTSEVEDDERVPLGAADVTRAFCEPSELGDAAVAEQVEAATRGRDAPRR